MISKNSGRRASAIGVSLGAMLLAAGCSSQPSIGPKTASGLPSHIDGGAGQVLRLCEKMHDSGDLTMAAAMCERAHRLDPGAPAPLLELASILGEMGEPDLTVEAYRTILRISPENTQAHYGLGRVHLDRGQHDLALTAFQAALRSDPEDPRLYSAAGVAQGLLGDHAQAQETFRDGLSVAPSDPALRNNLGLSLVQSGRYDEGLSVLESLAKDPGVERASRENLVLAQGLAAAAHAEAVLAQARAMAEAQAEAEAMAMAQIPAEAEAEVETGVETGAEAEPKAAVQMANAGPDEAASQAAAPEFEVTYPQSAWPMDGPGEDGMTPMARRAPPKPAGPGPIAAPTPLTKAMIAPPPARAPAHASAHASAHEQATRSPFETTSRAIEAPRFLTRPQERQTARSPLDGASDIGPDGPFTWTLPREEMTAAPPRLVMIPPPTATTPPPATGQTAGTFAGQGYAVQFASYTSEERAWRGWDSLRGAAGNLLEGVEPKVRRADLGGDMGVVYRLRTAPTPKASAESLCAALRAQGVECLVVKSQLKMAGGGAASRPATL